MTALTTFFEGWLDYAGLFPPAQLPFDQAMLRFTNSQKHALGKMISRFVIPVARLPEAKLWIESNQPQNPIHFSVLMTPPSSYETWHQSWQQDWANIEVFFNQKLGILDALETLLPKSEVALFDSQFLTNRSQNLPVFVEMNCEQLQTVEPRLPSTIKLKFRTGGLTPDSVPKPELLARMIQFSLKSRRPAKVTAGLHQATTHFDSSVGCELYGFFNVFCAWYLASIYTLSDAELVDVLTEKDANSFDWKSSHGFQFKQWKVSTEQIRNARVNVLQSVGSCSFDEPCAALNELGLNPQFSSIKNL